MSEFTLYNFQCCPFRSDIPRDRNSQVFGVGDLTALDKLVLDNMAYHQDLIDHRSGATLQEPKAIIEEQGAAGEVSGFLL